MKKERRILNSRLCDFLEKGKEKELSNILFPTTGGKSICSSNMESLVARGTEEAGESSRRKPTEVMAWLKRYCVSTRHARNCQRPKSLYQIIVTWRTQ